MALAEVLDTAAYAHSTHAWHDLGETHCMKEFPAMASAPCKSRESRSAQIGRHAEEPGIATRELRGVPKSSLQPTVKAG
jgi:hypothetical protein